MITLDQIDKVKFMVDPKFNAILDKDYESQQGKTKKYMIVLGSLMHLAVFSTLPTAFATSTNARVMSMPKPIHYEQLMHTVG